MISFALQALEEKISMLMHACPEPELVDRFELYDSAYQLSTDFSSASVGNRLVPLGFVIAYFCH